MVRYKAQTIINKESEAGFEEVKSGILNGEALMTVAQIKETQITKYKIDKAKISKESFTVKGWDKVDTDVIADQEPFMYTITLK